MLDYNNYNKEAFLLLRPKYYNLIMIILLLIVLLIYLLFHTKTYDVYNYQGIYKDNLLLVNIPVEEVYKVTNNSHLLVDNTFIKFSIKKISDVQYDKTKKLNYQTIYLCTSQKYLNNMSLNIAFYNNKQRIIMKLFQLLI